MQEAWMSFCRNNFPQNHDFSPYKMICTFVIASGSQDGVSLPPGPGFPVIGKLCRIHILFIFCPRFLVTCFGENKIEGIFPRVSLPPKDILSVCSRSE